MSWFMVVKVLTSPYLFSLTEISKGKNYGHFLTVQPQSQLWDAHLLYFCHSNHWLMITVLLLHCNYVFGMV